MNCVRALTEGEQLWGVWFDRTKEYHARLRGKSFKKLEFAVPYQVKLSPLPCWEHLSAQEQQVQAKKVVDSIANETQERNEREGRSVLGAPAVMQEHPHARPALSKRSPAPWCHTASKAMRKGFKVAYRLFASLYRSASSRFRKGDRVAEFPANCFPPALGYLGAG